jgi:serine/threonine protein kinase
MLKKIEIGDKIGTEFVVYGICGGEGKSGMGIVYICAHIDVKSLLALKTFQDRYINSNDIKDSFKQEALAWINLDRHPNIVNAGTFAIIDDRPFIYMEFIAPDKNNRNTLDDYLKENLSDKQVLDWAIQFCHGMEHANSHGLFSHRDIKPANIMIRADKLLKITDFGLAKLWDSKTDSFSSKNNEKDLSQLTIFNNTNGQSIAGTPPWMAPEQFDGHADVKSDIYSFGITLYQMINRGKLPFNCNTYEEWENAHKTVELPNIDSEIFPIVKKCLNKNPVDRYNDFKELRNDLEKIFKNTGEKLYSPESIEQSADMHVTKGYGFQNLGFREEAYSEYIKAAQIDSKSCLTRINTGSGFHDLNKLDEAIIEYKKAIELEPDNSMAHYNLGNVYYESKMFTEAIIEYKKAIELNPEFKECHVNYGNLLRDMDKIDESITELKTALDIDPNFFKAKINLGITLTKKQILKKLLIRLRMPKRLILKVHNCIFIGEFFLLKIMKKKKEC